jgi:hypothetical protein
MMNNVIDKALGVIEIESETVGEVINMGRDITTPAIPTSIEDVDDDYKFQRDNFYRLVEQGSTAIEGILELAREGEHPRAYEVAGNLIKQVSEVTEKLGDLQEKMRKLKEVPNNAPKSVTNALFVGSTAELQKMLKEK